MRSRPFVAAFMGLACLAGHTIAGPGDGIRLGSAVKVSPFAGVGVTYDSNALTAPTGEQDDMFLDLTAGVDLRGQSAWGTASLRAWFQDRSYDKQTARDSENMSETFAATLGDADRVELSLRQGYSKSTDYSFDERVIGLAPMDRSAYDLPLLEGVALAVEREQQSYGATLRRAFVKLGMSVGAEYADTDYEADDFSDWSELTGNVSADYELSPKTAAAVDLEAGEQDSDGLTEKPTFASVRAGLKYAATGKVNVRATVGYRQHDAGTAPDGTDLNSECIDYKVEGSWQASRKIVAQASGMSSIVPSEAYANNTKRVDEASLALIFGLTDRFGASVSAQYRRDSYTAAIADETSPDQNAVGGIATFTYKAPGDFLTVSLQARYDTFDSNFEDDVDVLRVCAAANVRY